MSTEPTRIAFVDWMKAVGITLIVFGHVVGWSSASRLAPIWTKQLGVAFFLFVLGYSIARDERSPRQQIFRRLFDVYFFGLVLALFVSVVGVLLDHNPRESNYLPFIAGANVLLDFFPANPTTWYVGTYVHFVVMGALLVRRVRITMPLLACVLIVEIVSRAALLQWAGQFIAYMSLANWMTAFLCGAYCGQRRIARLFTRSWQPATLLALFLVGWAIAVPLADLRPGFPFMLPRHGGAWIIALSASISVIYTVTTVLAFALVSHWRNARLVRFISQNTLIVFLAHMPIYYSLLSVIPVDRVGVAGRSAILFTVCLPGLATASALIHRVIDVAALRVIVFRWTERWFPDQSSPNSRLTASA